jgi:CubicO group peptidase (beta-lactamase class C family)
MQLLLNGGAYGGRQWFEPQTVALFTQKTFGNHRSLGFDHPSRENRHARARTAPPGVFGHSGFTGTCAWADPERRLVFVFLSNRTFPDDEKRRFIRKNIRGRIHQVAYDAVWTYSPELPSLD